MEPNKEIQGFIHNISPIKKSKTTSYFDMDIQTKTEVVRGVCFASGKHSDFQTMSKNKSPDKLNNFTIKNNWGTPNILMNSSVQLEEAKYIDFKPRSMEATQTITTLSSANSGQLVTLKAKVVQLSAPKKIKTKNGFLTKAEAFLIDPHGSIKVVLWENFATQLQEATTYVFTNLRVQKDSFTHQVYLSTPKTGCDINQTDPFEERLALPTQLPETFTTTTLKADVIGVNNYFSYHSCCQCNKKVTPEGSGFVKCTNCGLKQKFAMCTTHCNLKGLLKTDDGQITVTVFDKIIQEVFTLMDKKETNMSEENVTETLDTNYKGNL